MNPFTFLPFAALATLAATLAAATPATPPTSPLPPTDLPALTFTNAFFPGTHYRPTIPTHTQILGFDSGARATTTPEILRCLQAWTNAAPDRTRLVEYARSYENRPLHYLVVSSPNHLAHLDQILSDLARLGDPRSLDDTEANRLLASLPAVAWLGATIHGDETEGSDACLALLYHLVAADDPDLERLLNDVIVLVDPVANPDGRDRFVKMIAENRGAYPNVDDQALVHDGYWPFGRGNHYLFDLNRDLAWAVHPESRGRIREITRWSPHLVVDAHGMGSQDTHLFSPPRDPVNPNMPAGRVEWAEVFARDQARALDRHGLTYYNGEWHEEWFPGYTDAWASYRAAIGMLYEQARIAENGVRRPEGRILSYRESVLHHVLGFYSNLRTLQAHAPELRRHAYNTRKTACAPDGPYTRRIFAIPPSDNRGRLDDFLRLLQCQGFDVCRATADFVASQATDQLGRHFQDLKFPAGTLLVPNRQPLGHLVAAFLEFDPHFAPAVLEEERRDLLRRGRSRIYDTTAWNYTMTYGLPAFTLDSTLPAAVEPFPPVASTPSKPTLNSDNPVAYAIDGADDRSLAAAARLMERGVRVRIAEKVAELDGARFTRGSIFITRLDNRTFPGDLRAALEQTTTELGLNAVALASGQGQGRWPDLGGEHFQLLEPLRLGIFSRGSINSSDFGSIWFVLDQRLGIRYSALDDAAPQDLSRYNVLVMPDRWGARATDANLGPLKDWVRAGGTLIAIGSAAQPLIAEKAEFSKVRPLPDVLNRLPEFELAVLRDWLGRAGPIPAADAVWTHQPATRIDYPWQLADGPQPDEKELRKRDSWQSLFMPQGAFLAARCDTNHWLTTGCGEWLPVLVGARNVLMAADGVEAPIRYGYLVDAPKTNPPPVTVTSTGPAPSNPTPSPAQPAQAKPADPTSKDTDRKDKKEPPRVGWCALPPGTDLYLRMSGLLWPEAAHRLANAVAVSRESFGRGQIILFANPPTFRGASRGTERLFLNAIVYGPGFGTPLPIRP
jgi:hypothetical protein